MKIIALIVGAVCAIKSPAQTQTKFSPSGEPLHGIVGWDDLNMKPTQMEENGARSPKAEEDEYQESVFRKYGDAQGLFSRQAALGAVQEIIGKWKHLSAAQTNRFLKSTFDEAFESYDVNKNRQIAYDEMFGLVQYIYSG